MFDPSSSDESVSAKESSIESISSLSSEMDSVSSMEDDSNDIVINKAYRGELFKTFGLFEIPSNIYRVPDINGE